MQLTQRKRIGHNVQSSFSIRFRIGKVIYKLKNDPIKLLKTFELCSLTYEENRYDVQIVDDALKNFMNIMQKEDDPHPLYSKI